MFFEGTFDNLEFDSIGEDFLNLFLKELSTY